MSDETKILAEQLEKATAPGNIVDDTLDAETKALREGWLALDQLIEATQPSETELPELQFPMQPQPATKSKLAVAKKLAALATLAASLLAAALLTWSFVDGRQGEKIVKNQSNETQTPSPIEEVSAPVLVQDEQKPSDTAADELDWDAPLDNEIAAAGQEMLRIQSDWYASDDTSSAVYYRMQQMQQDLSDNTL